MDMNQYNADQQRFVQLFSKFTGIREERLADFLKDQPVNLLMEHTDLLDITQKQREKLKELRELKNVYGALKSSNKEYTVSNPSQAGAYFQAYFEDVKEKEYVVCSFLTTKNQIIATKVLSSGVVNESAVYPREIVKAALLHDANSVIMAHNHPSGNPEPSQQDIDLTHAVKYALDTVNINLVDHIVTGKDHYISLAEKGLYQQKSTSKWSGLRVAGSKDNKVQEDMLEPPRDYTLQYIVTHLDPTKEGRNASAKRDAVSRVVTAESPLEAIEKGWERIARIPNTSNIKSIEYAGMSWSASPLDLQDYLNQQHSQSKLNETLEHKVKLLNASSGGDERLVNEHERGRWFHIGCTSAIETIADDLKQVTKLYPPELMLELQWGKDIYKKMISQDRLEEAEGLRILMDKAREGGAQEMKDLKRFFDHGSLTLEIGETLELQDEIPRKIWNLDNEIILTKPGGAAYAPEKEIISDQFHDAICGDKTAIIEKMIREVPDMRLISSHTGHLASRGHTELAEQLIDKAQNLDGPGTGYLIYRFAEDRKDKVVAQLSQKAGQSKDLYMTEALSLCADNNSFTTAGYLLRKGADFKALKSTWDYWKQVGLITPVRDDFFRRLEKYNTEVVEKEKLKAPMTLNKGITI